MPTLADLGTLFLILVGMAQFLWASWTGFRFRHASETSRKVTVRSYKRVRLRVAALSFSGLFLLMLGMAVGGANEDGYTNSGFLYPALAALLCCPTVLTLLLVGQLTVPGYRLFSEEEMNSESRGIP